MHSCNPFSISTQDVVLAAGRSDDANNPTGEKASFTITELAHEFGITHRALRFYESRDLLAPHRDGRKRIYSRCGPRAPRA